MRAATSGLRVLPPGRDPAGVAPILSTGFPLVTSAASPEKHIPGEWSANQPVVAMPSTGRLGTASLPFFGPVFRRGYTLIEMGIAISMGVMVAIMVLALVNQQIAFTKIFNTQSFLITEAPIINTYLTRLCGRADGFKLYGSVANAVAGSSPMSSGATVLQLHYRQADGVLRSGLLSFEDRGSGVALYYYIVPASGSLGAPNLMVTKKPTAVTFAIVNGLLCTTLTGPAGEQIVYTSATQL